MIEEREAEGEKKGKRCRGKGKERDDDSEGQERTSSRSRSRSPITPQHAAPASKNRRKKPSGVLEGGESDDPDDPFYVSPSRPLRNDDEEEKDETAPLITSTTSGSNPLTRTTSAQESNDRGPSDGDDEDEVPASKWYQGPLFEAGWKLSLLFLVFTIIMVGGIYLGMPRLDP
jgi:hypothetical protein